MKRTKKERVVVISVEVSRNWTWLCAYKQRSAHPKSNYKMLQDHSMKLVSLSLFHPIFSLFVAQAFNLFSSLQGLFHAFSRKIKAPLYSPVVPLHESILEDPLSLFLSNECSEKGGWAYHGGGRGGWRGVKNVGLDSESTWFWCNNHRLTFSCACAHPSSYVLNLKSWWDQREYNHEQGVLRLQKPAQTACFLTDTYRA